MIGPNGAGKTTLFRMITGAGAARRRHAARSATRVELAYVDQSRDALDPAKTVWEEISGGQDQIKVGDRWVNSRQYAASFNFRGSDQQKQVAQALGRRAQPAAPREAAARAAATCCCSTSRPTTSTSTRCARSRRRCSSFAGCAVVISHDRWFLDRVATHVLAFEGDSQVRWFEGNFEAYEEHRRARLGAEADRPKRITYKRLVR